MLFSSKFTLGRHASYGSAYRSTTSSIQATNSAPTSGIHQCLACQGLSTFFLTAVGHSHMRTRYRVPTRPPDPPTSVRSSVCAPRVQDYTPLQSHAPPLWLSAWDGHQAEAVR